MDIAIVIYDGFDDLDAIGPFEVFNHAVARGADCEVGIYTITPQERVKSSHGLRLIPDGDLPANPSLLVVPGGGWGDRADVGAWGEAERGELPEAVANRHAKGSTVATVCTGGMLAARAGLTAGRPAITHRAAIADLRESGAEVVDARVVDDGDLLTAGGVTAGIDLALYLVEREIDPELADQIAGEMEYERQGEVWRA